MTSYIKILQKLDAFCNAHLQIKKFMGEFREQMPNFSTLDERYPVVFATPVSDSEDLNTNQFTLEIYCVDIIQKDRANINTIVSDCHLILKDMFIYYRDDNDLDLDVVGTASISFVNNFDLDYVAGAVMTITFEVAGYGSCEIPMEPITPVTNECEPAILIVKDSDDNILYTLTVDSGDTYTQEISDATAVLKDTSGTVLSTTSILAEGSEDITAPDATYTVQYENGTPIESGSIVSGGSVLVEIPDPVVCEDVDLYVGEANVGSFPSGSDVFVKVIQDGLEVIPQDVTVVDDEVSIILEDSTPCPPVPIGATLMKTGQTISYRTGDDGDIEAGRDVDFFTLASPNPFNNTNRFTDELGGQTYANDIVIDWSTYNGATVFGLSRINIATGVNWDTAIDNCLAYSVGSFTSGWRLPNMKEIFNLVNYANVPGSFINYSPINLNQIGRLYWSSNTVIGGTSQAYGLNNVGMTAQFVKTSTTFLTYFPVRTFTVTGTTLT
jgi:hypothetical protein